MSRIVSPKHVFCTQKDQDVHKNCHHKCVLKKQPIIESCYLITMNIEHEHMHSFLLLLPIFSTKMKKKNWSANKELFFINNFMKK